MNIKLNLICLGALRISSVNNSLKIVTGAVIRSVTTSKCEFKYFLHTTPRQSSYLPALIKDI